MSLSEPLAISAAPRRTLVMAGFGLFGAAALGLALTIDYFGGVPGLGKKELIALGAGVVSLLIATWIRYSAEGGLAGALRFGAVALQVSLVYVLLNQYALENKTFHEFIFPLVLAGFLGGHFVPKPAKPLFFLVVSLIGMVGAMGVTDSLLMAVLGMVLIGLCHLPVSLWLRLALIVAVTAALAAVRAGMLPYQPVTVILPIFSSIFMFRLAIYLYDLSTGGGPKDWPSRLSYFFMLPNFVFPFFPVVDFAQWGRSQNHDDGIDVYQRGAIWLFYGAVHLLLYRVVNYYLIMDPVTVQGFGDFLYYVIINFALYLKVSGLFHSILGCLFMFGFALPETHSRYYMSFSFIELWRRTNIYWKDFMQKVVFNPAYMMLKKRGMEHINAVVVAIVAVFLITWFTHAYQWFWLQGSFLLTGPDALFWFLLGLFLIVQTVEENKPPKPGARALIGPQALLAIRTVATMLTLCILWSLWSSTTMREWFDLLVRAGFTVLDPVAPVTVAGVLQSAAITVLFVVLVAFAVGYTFGLAPRGSHPRKVSLSKKKKDEFAFARHAMLVTAGAVALMLVQYPSVHRVLPGAWQLVVLDLGRQRLSALDQATLERGYYENLTSAKLLNSDLFDLNMAKPDNWEQVREMDAVRLTGDYLEYELLPNRVTVFKEGLFQTNSGAFRDKEYSVAKPAGTYRIAMLGASRAMGAGVNNNEVFEALIEDELNRRAGQPVELLNFAVGGYRPIQNLITLENKVMPYTPDTLLYIAHNNDFMIWHLASQYAKGMALPYPFLDEIAAEAGLTRDMGYDEVDRRLKPFGPRITAWVYQQIADRARSMGSEPVWVFIPSAESYKGPDPEAAALQALAEDAGFRTLNLDDLYRDNPGEQYWLRPWDRHPNTAGHKLHADRMVEEFAKPEFAPLFGLGG